MATQDAGLGASRDQTWMATTACLAVFAFATTLFENAGEGPEGLVLPLLLLPVLTFVLHAVRRLPWWVFLSGAVVGPSIVFFFGNQPHRDSCRCWVRGDRLLDFDGSTIARRIAVA